MPVQRPKPTRDENGKLILTKYGLDSITTLQGTTLVELSNEDPRDLDRIEKITPQPPHSSQP